MRTAQRRRSTALITVAALVAGTFAARAATAQGGEGEVPGPAQVVLQIVPRRTSIATINATFGTTTIDSIVGLSNVYLVEGPVGSDPDLLAAAIDAAPGVTFAEANAEVETPAVAGTRIYRWSDSDPVAAGTQWADALLGLDDAHTRSTGAGVVVGVVDSGVQLLPGAHPDLAASLLPGIDFVDGDAVPDDEANGIDDDGNGEIDEGAGHGTHVAGILHRTAPDASILPVRVLDSDGGGDEWSVAKGMFWAADHGAGIINVSAGKHGSASLLVKTVAALEKRNVLVVAAAGNDGRNRNERPASAPCALAVTGSTSTDTVATFSTLGGWVDVSAPAEGIVSTFPFSAAGYASWDGTSMAAPFVAGQAALLRAQAPGLKVGEVIAYVKGSAIPTLDGADRAGFGRVSPTASLDLLAAGPPPDRRTVRVPGGCY